MSERKPTEEGRRRYADTDGYYRGAPLDAQMFPCLCAESCSPCCDGRCGCMACRLGVVDRRMAKFPRVLS